MSVAVREPGAVIEEEPIRSRRGLVWEAVKRRPSAIFGGVLLLLVILGALLAPVLAPYDQHQQVGPVFGHPSASHPLGLDDGGIDIVTLLMWAARTSLLVGFAATLVSMLIGGAIGVLARHFGGGGRPPPCGPPGLFPLVSPPPPVGVLPPAFGAAP